MLIGLGYQARVGKDSLASFLERDHGFRKAAFADKLRDLAEEIDPIIAGSLLEVRSIGSTRVGLTHYTDAVYGCGYELAKDEYPHLREFLQNLGQGVRKVLGEDTWVRAVLDNVQPGEDVVITDVRYPNEADAIKAAGGFVVRVVRPGYGPANAHISERALEGYPFDFTVHNEHGLEDLAAAAADLLQAIKTMGWAVR